MIVKKRSIPLAIIFSIITCGIYAIYWMICLNDDINALAGGAECDIGRYGISVNHHYVWYLRNLLEL